MLLCFLSQVTYIDERETFRFWHGPVVLLSMFLHSPQWEGAEWVYIFPPIYEEMHMVGHWSPEWGYSQDSLSSHGIDATPLERLENKSNGLNSSGMRFKNLCGGKINR